MTGPAEPACWSWKVPPLRSPEEIAEQCALIAAAQPGRPRDLQLDVDAVPDIYGGDPRLVRWREFHDGLTTLESWRRGRSGRRCAGCGCRDRLVTDHDHRTGLERGELCHGCNVAEGSRYAAGATGWAAAYRARSPAIILGHVRYYTGPRDWALVWGDGTLWYENTDRARRLTGNPAWEPVEGAVW